MPLFLKPPPMMPMLTMLLEPPPPPLMVVVPCPYLPLRVLLAQMMGHQQLRVNLIGGLGDFSSVLGGNEQEQRKPLDQDK